MTIETQNGELINYDHVSQIFESHNVTYVVKARIADRTNWVVIACYDTEVEADSCIHDIKMAVMGDKRIVSFKE